MSFEIKLDKDRMPISDPIVKQQMHADTPEEQPEQIQQAVTQEASVEVQESEQIQPVTEQQTATESVEVPTQKDTVAQDSFRQLRLKAEQAERERDELIRMLKERELHTQTQQKQVVEPEEDNEVNVGSDDLVEGKHLTKVGRQIKQLKKEIELQKKQAAEMVTEARLKAAYPDFEKIVSPENINALRLEYPEIANTINTSSGDLYSKAVSAYTMIKKLVHKEIETPVYKADKERAAINAAKPRPLTSMAPTNSTSPLTQANAFANGLTKELQEQLRREMEEARRAM